MVLTPSRAWQPFYVAVDIVRSCAVLNRKDHRYLSPFDPGLIPLVRLPRTTGSRQTLSDLLLRLHVGVRLPWRNSIDTVTYGRWDKVMCSPHAIGREKDLYEECDLPRSLGTNEVQRLSRVERARGRCLCKEYHQTMTAAPRCLSNKTVSLQRCYTF